MTEKEQKYIERLQQAYNEFLNYEKEIEQLVLCAADHKNINDDFRLKIEKRLEYLEKRIPLRFLDIFYELDSFINPTAEIIINSEDVNLLAEYLKNDFLERINKVHRYFNSIRILLRCYFL